MNTNTLKALSVSRKHDAVVAVQQNNDSKTINIEGLNYAAEKLLGFSHDELKGHPIFDILPENIEDDIKSFVEYDNDGSDLASVLNHMPHFSVTDKEGHVLPVTLKVFYIMADSVNVPRFELLIRDHSRYDLIQNITQKPSMDEMLSIPNMEGTRYIVGLIQDYTQHHMLEASLATIAIDQIDTLSADHQQAILPLIRDRLNRCCRQEDTLTYLGNSIFGLFLMDCGGNNAQIPLNRLRTNIESCPFTLDDGTTLHLTISANYTEITSEKPADDLITLCFNQLINRDKSKINCVLGS